MAKRDEPAKPKTPQSDRETKLAQALRANLRRRKGGPESKPPTQGPPTQGPATSEEPG